jgi:predicted secreted protein
MTLPTTLKFAEMLILIGNGGAPETFAEPCGLTARSFNLGSALRQEAVIGGDWDEAEAGSLSCNLSGSGVMAVESYDVWHDWIVSRAPHNVQVQLTGVGTYQGAFLLSELSLQGSRSGGRVSIELAMSSAGAVVFTP